MIPNQNELSSFIYGVKRTLSQFGMEYEKIHVCLNDCILYKKEYDNVESWLVSGDSRYKRTFQRITMKEGVPTKVIWYFSSYSSF